MHEPHGITFIYVAHDQGEEVSLSDRIAVMVLMETFDSNESMLAKLQSGADDYDVVFPSAYMAAAMQAQNRL